MPTQDFKGTLTGTGKFTADETATLLSKAPKTGVIGGDGIAGEKLKSLRLTIEDGTSANTIKCTVVSAYNGDVIGATDNVAKGATTGNFTLNAGGTELRIEAAGLTGNVVGVLSRSIDYNDSALTFVPNTVSGGNDIIMTFFDLAVTIDITTIAAGKQVQMLIEYVTSA